MNATISVTREVTTLVNVLTVEPENQAKLLESLRENTDNVVSTLAGWISTSFAAGPSQKPKSLGINDESQLNDYSA